MVKNKVLQPRQVNSFFEDYFESLEFKELEDREELEKMADEVATDKTKYGARVFNDVYQSARCPQQTFHSTYWRDKQITKAHLEAVEKAQKVIDEKGVNIYTFWVRSGSGDQNKLWQIIFTKKGVPLALSAAIMMEPLFEDPEEQGLVIDGLYFAVPELMEIVKGQEEPLILFNLAEDSKANVWVGGSDYPGEIYKPICKSHNGWVYDLGGFEAHSSAYTAEYLNREVQGEKSLVVISGLSLHGKSTLSTTSGVQPGFFKGVTKKKEVPFAGIHDDYVAFLPLDEKKKNWEVFAYAPMGLFPACHGDSADNPLTADSRAALYSVFIEEDKTPNFNKKINGTVNQRAASPLDTLEVFRSGQRQVKNFDRLLMVILTRNNFCPSAVVFEDPVDFAWSYAGVVVQKTDAVEGDFPDIYYNFACTDFDVVPRAKYLARIVKTLKDFPVPVTLAMMNTGKPGPRESMRVRDAIASGWFEANLDEKLGVKVVSEVPGVDKLYYPWKQGGYEYEEVVEEWEKQRAERREFMQGKGKLQPEELSKLIGKPGALV